MQLRIFRDGSLKFSRLARSAPQSRLRFLIAEAEEARSKAMGDKGGAAAAVAAITVKTKVAGLWRDKVAGDRSVRREKRAG
jgi:hypothetical protein